MGAAYYVEFLLRSTVSVETIRNAVIGASGNFTLQRGIAENGAPTSVFRQHLPGFRVTGSRCAGNPEFGDPGPSPPVDHHIGRIEVGVLSQDWR